MLVIVKKSSPKNLSVNCRPTVDRHTADSRPIVGRLSVDRRPTVDRQSTDRFFGEVFFTITHMLCYGYVCYITCVMLYYITCVVLCYNHVSCYVI